jgi:Glycosyltransferase family 87
MTLRTAVAVWAVLVLAVTGRVAIAPARSHTVVPVYLTASERFARGEGLYDPADGLDAYLYPPEFAAALVPLTWVPEKVAGIFWRLLGAGLFVTGLVRLGRGVLRLDDRGLAWLLVLPVPLVISSLDNGQANLHMAGLMCLGVAALSRERPTAAAGWISLAVGIKLYPFAAGLLAGVVRPRLALILVGLSAVVILSPFVVANADYVRTQFRELREDALSDDRLNSTAPTRMPKDWTILTRTWAGWIPTRNQSQGISAVAGLVFAGIVFAARRRPFDRQVFLAFALGSVWMTLVGPSTEPQTYTLLAAPLAATVVTTRGRAKVLAVAAWWLFTIPVIRDAFPNGWRLGVYGPQPVGAMVLLMALLVDTFGAVAVERTGRTSRWPERLIPARRTAA